MNLFYIRHHYQSIVRSPTFNGAVFAFTILVILFASSIASIYGQIDDYTLILGEYMGSSEAQYTPFLVLYIMSDWILKIVFKRPFPMLKYYTLWIKKPETITIQYLITTLFGFLPILLFINLVAMVFKAAEWMGIQVAVCMIGWWIATHFLSLTTQVTKPFLSTLWFSVIAALVIVSLYFPEFEIGTYLLHPLVTLTALVSGVVLCYFTVVHFVNVLPQLEIKDKKTFLESIPALNFNNPVVQLEWSLIARNKRTRTNLLFGFIAILVLPFLIDSDVPSGFRALVFFITTGFFIIQHGTYSLGWEGTYFDFLMVNIPIKVFIKTRYNFYIATAFIGFLLGLIPIIILNLNITDLASILFYNIGITVPLTLYRSTFHNSKIDLSGNSFMNYDGMMTGPIMLSTFLVMLIPMMLYGIGYAILGENGLLLFGGIGLIGILLKSVFINSITETLQKKKYQLSQSFKS